MGPRTTPVTVDPDGLSDVAFQAYLAEAPLVTVNEAYRAMLILADGEDQCKSFEARAKALEERKILRPGWELKKDNVIDQGSVAYMVCRICEVHGGVNMRLFGSWGLGDRRYALRELIYREMVDEDTVEYEYVKGAEFTGLLAKADDLMAEKGLYETQKVQLTDETDRDAEGNLIVPPPAEEQPTGGP